MGTRVVRFNTFRKRFPSGALVLIRGPLTESEFCLFLPRDREGKVLIGLLYRRGGGPPPGARSCG